MRTTTRLMILAATLGFAATSTMATDYTFTGYIDNTWDKALNWDPAGGPPDEGDKAIIPDGKHCQVIDDDQWARTIDVQEGGTLGIVGKTLDLGARYSSTTSQVNGKLYLKKSGVYHGKLQLHWWVTVNGSGTITGRKQFGYEGKIIEAPVVHVVGLRLGPGMTLAGTITVRANLDLQSEDNTYATAVVDHPDDVMTLGTGFPSATNNDIHGTGKFQVSAGLLQIKYVNFKDPTPMWELTAGEIDVYDCPVSDTLFTELNVKIDISGGTLDIHDDFRTKGDFQFTAGGVSGATIIVAQGKAARFEEW